MPVDPTCARSCQLLSATCLRFCWVHCEPLQGTVMVDLPDLAPCLAPAPAWAPSTSTSVPLPSNFMFTLITLPLLLLLRWLDGTNQH